MVNKVLFIVLMMFGYWTIERFQSRNSEAPREENKLALLRLVIEVELIASFNLDFHFTSLRTQIIAS